MLVIGFSGQQFEDLVVGFQKGCEDE